MNPQILVIHLQTMDHILQVTIIKWWIINWTRRFINVISKLYIESLLQENDKDAPADIFFMINIIFQRQVIYKFNDVVYGDVPGNGATSLYCVCARYYQLHHIIIIQRTQIYYKLF